MFMILMKRRGFTLIELLVVVAIIAILSATGLSLFANAQKSARDGRRRADLRNMQNAAEQYYLSNSNSYPTAQGSLTSFLEQGTLPTDPKAGSAYSYSFAVAAYQICLPAATNLEMTASGFCVKSLQ